MLGKRLWIAFLLHDWFDGIAETVTINSMKGK
jgi:hypothetical protein